MASIININLVHIFYLRSNLVATLPSLQVDYFTHLVFCRSISRCDNDEVFNNIPVKQDVAVGFYNSRALCWVRVT